MNNIKKNYKRLNNVISYINNKYYIGKLYLLIDIFICKIKYKANLNDYKMFSMYLLNNKERKTLLTSGKNLVLANKLNDNSQLHIFLYKNEFNLLMATDGKPIITQTDEFEKTFLDYVVEYHSVNGVRYLYEEYGIKITHRDIGKE